MKGIHAHFIPDPQPYQKAACHAQREACDIERREAFGCPKASEGDFQIRFNHGYTFTFVRPPVAARNSQAATGGTQFSDRTGGSRLFCFSDKDISADRLQVERLSAAVIRL